MDEAHDLASRVTATKEELSRIEAELKTLPHKKELLLGADVFNERELTKLEQEESTLTRRRELLTQRLPILEQQKEVEAAQRAQARITDLITESASLVREYEARMREFNAATEQMTQASEKLIAAYAAIQSTHDEAEYYQARYAGIAPATLANVSMGAFIPSADDVGRLTLEPLRQFWLLMHGSVPGNPWRRRINEITERKQAVRTQDVRPHIRQHA